MRRLKLTGEQARKLTDARLQALPRMIREMEDARTRVSAYGRVLKERCKNLRLRKYAGVSPVFERIWRAEIGEA